MRRDLEHITEHFPHSGGQRRQLRLQARRQEHVLQLFQHLLAREIIVRAIAEGQRHDGQPRDRHRPQLGLARHAGHLPLNRQRDIALHLFRCLTGILGDDLDLHILHVGEGFDRQIGHGAIAESA